MKQCPVCKESFQDDLNFCDLDGSPLDGGTENTAAGSSSKLWSFLGIALLLAAVGITAGAIIFFPRGPSAALPAGRSQTGQAGGGAGQSSSASYASDAANAQADGSSGNLDRSVPKSGSTDAAASSSPDQTRLASRRAALSKNDNTDSSLPNPKSVVSSDDELTRAARPSADDTRPRTSKPPSIADNGPNTGAAATDSSGSDTAAAPARRRARAQAQSDGTESNGNKKDDKKKGGFLRVFKKIFGHG